MIKRFWIVVASVVAVVALVAGSTFALFSAVSGNEQNTFTSGTVSLDSTAMIPFRVAGIAPGDSGTQPVSVTYTGSLDAFVGLDSSVTGTLSSCDTTYPIQVNITSDTTMVSLTGTGTNQLIGRFGTGAVIPLQVHWNLDLRSPNPCQEGVATVNLVVHAVQAQNNEGTNGPVSWGGSSNPDYTTCNATGEYSSAGACLVTSSPVSGHVTPWQGFEDRDGSTFAVDPHGQRQYKVHLTPGTYVFTVNATSLMEFDISDRPVDYYGPWQWPGGPYDFGLNPTVTLTAPAEGTYYFWIFGQDATDGDYTISWSKQQQLGVQSLGAPRVDGRTSVLERRK